MNRLAHRVMMRRITRSTCLRWVNGRMDRHADGEIMGKLMEWIDGF